MNKFTLKDGQKSQYALACGYIQSYEKDDIKVSLYQDGCYHIKTYENDSRISWECYDTIAQARKAYKIECKIA